MDRNSAIETTAILDFWPEPEQTLQLEEHKGRGQKNYNTNCKLCGEEIEDMVHFLTKCKNLEIRRDYNIIDKDIRNPEERMRKLLYRNEKYQEVGKMIKNLWTLRRELKTNLVVP